MLALRRTIYLTIKSSLDFEETAHKLLKLNLKPGQEVELCHMVLDCCAQERTYEKFFGLLAQVRLQGVGNGGEGAVKLLITFIIAYNIWVFWGDVTFFVAYAVQKTSGHGIITPDWESCIVFQVQLILRAQVDSCLLANTTFCAPRNVHH